MSELTNCNGETLVNTHELKLLRRVLATSSDLVKGRDWPEFRDACGGITQLETAHSEAVAEIEDWYTDGVDCRDLL